ncbi:MAG TPA: hypothetical protein DCF91_07270 [Porphyromonadaceae bacterium]|nr:hypothetical protein [Porphyromonadaceae bacterium]
MARPIKETPVLKVRAASLFKEKIKADDKNKISQSKKDEIKDSYNKIANLAQFYNGYRYGAGSY